MENNASETVHPLDNILNSVTVDNGSLMDDLDPFNQTSGTSTNESSNMLQPTEVNPETFNNDDVFGPLNPISATDQESNGEKAEAVVETNNTTELEQSNVINDSSATKTQRVCKLSFIYLHQPNMIKIIGKQQYFLRTCFY